MIKYTRTRSGRSYDLTAPMSVAGRQQRRRAGMSEHRGERILLTGEWLALDARPASELTNKGATLSAGSSGRA